MRCFIFYTEQQSIILFKTGTIKILLTKAETVVQQQDDI